jgi:GNAT superfamily N-acetyltransferase
MSGIAGSFKLFGGLSMRFARPDDKPVLFEMFLAARPWLAQANHDRDYLRALYEQQIQAHETGAGTAYPNHVDLLVEKTGQVVGRVIIHLALTEWRIVEFEIHPLAQGKGIGADLMRSLQAAAATARAPMRVGAAAMMPEMVAFFRHCGFQVTASEPPIIQMIWYPPVP